MAKSRKIIIISESLNEIDLLREVAAQLHARVKTHLVSGIGTAVDRMMRSRKEPPDLILFYVPYPSTPVLHALHRLKGVPRYGHIPKILLSGIEDEKSLTLYANAGILRCFAMPRRPSAMKALMVSILGSY